MFKHELSIGIFISLFIILLTGFYIFRYNKSINSPYKADHINSSALKVNTSINQEKINLTLTEVQKHNSSSDCWVIDNNKVYNVTKYLNLHPGGVNEIVSFCGKDMTAAYDTKGDKNKPHSTRADQTLQQYLIGNFGSIVNIETIKNVPKKRGGEEN
jgi:cytochrome b involved in lipid metabolism